MFWIFLLFVASASAHQPIQPPCPRLKVLINATDCSSPWHHAQQYSVGSGHAKLASRKDWQTQLNTTHSELGISRVRFHGLFDDDMGPVVSQSPLPAGAEVHYKYNFTRIASTFDYILEIGMIPYVELSFQPTALASGQRTYLHYQANVTPPKNMTEWSNLITAFGTFLLHRYGAKELVAWKFEVWNEPDLHLIGPIKSFWTGTMAEYYTLFQVTSNALQSLSSAFHVGGPATSDTTRFLHEFHARVTQNSTNATAAAVSFLSSHAYPTAKATRNDFSTRIFNATHLAASLNQSFVLSEFNSGLGQFCCHDTEYAAIFLLREAAAVQTGGCTLSSLVGNTCNAQKYQVPLGMSYWTFTDIFEEVSSVEANALKSPFHNAFGMQTIQGIKKPVYRAMQLLNKLNIASTLNNIQVIVEKDEKNEITTGNVVEIYASTPTVVDAIANSIQMNVVLINFTPAPSRDAVPQNVSMDVATICIATGSTVVPGSIMVHAQQIDAQNSNSYRYWKNIWGSPNNLSSSQVNELNSRTQVVQKKWRQWSYDSSTHVITIQSALLLPISSVVMTLEYACASKQ